LNMRRLLRINIKAICLDQMQLSLGTLSCSLSMQTYEIIGGDYLSGCQDNNHALCQMVSIDWRDGQGSLLGSCKQLHYFLFLHMNIRYNKALMNIKSDKVLFFHKLIEIEVN
jgi:hypothetical protein